MQCSQPSHGSILHLQLIEPAEISEQALLDVHTLKYLTGLNTSSRKVAQVGTVLRPNGVLPICSSSSALLQAWTHLTMTCRSLRCGRWASCLHGSRAGV